MHPASASHGSRGQRYSIDFSPKHPSLYDSKQSKIATHHDEYRTSFGMTTPTPYTVKESRPHSRLSAPDPIPVPFQKSLYFKGGSNPYQPAPLTSNHDTPLILSPTHTPSPTNNHHGEEGDSLGYHSNKRRPNSLKNKKSMSGSIDTQLDGAIHGSIPWKGKVQVGPYRRSSIDNTPPIGWTSQTQFSNTAAAQKQGGKPPPADIQSLMPQEGTHRLIDMRSSNSTEIKPELFDHHAEGRRERLTHDKLPNEITDNMSVKRSNRSSSARQSYSRHQNFTNLPTEMTSSVKHFGELEPLGPINGLKYPSSVQSNKGELPQILDTVPQNKVR